MKVSVTRQGGVGGPLPVLRNRMSKALASTAGVGRETWKLGM